VASETGNVPCLSQSHNSLIINDLLATRTDLSEELKVVELTVSLAFVLKVLALDECLTTDTALETLWMP